MDAARARDLRRCLDRPIGPDYHFLHWLEDLAPFGEEVLVRAGLVFARFIQKSIDEDLVFDPGPPMDGRLGAALDAVDAWLSDPSEAHRLKCAAAAEAAAECARAAQALRERIPGRVIRDNYGDAVEVRKTKKNQMRDHDAYRELRLAEICSATARLAAATAPRERIEHLKTACGSGGSGSGFVPLTFAEAHAVTRDGLLAWIRPLVK